MYKLAHVGIQVSNMERSLRFYTEALGGKKGPEFTMKSGAFLTFVEFADFSIELIYKKLDDRRPGPNHMAIAVDDIYAAVRKVAAAGFPAKESDIGHMGDHAKNIFITGPDGEMIELCEGALY